MVGITYEADHQKIIANYSVKLDEKMHIKSCAEKPEHSINDIKGTGFCVFGKQCLCLLKDIYDTRNNTPNNLCDFVNLLMTKKYTGIVFEVADTEFNINTATDLARATDFLCKSGGCD